MENLYLEGNQHLPRVTFDKNIQLFEISGVSNESNAEDYYKPVFEWLDLYIKDPLQFTIFQFKIQYYNSESSYIFFKIMQKIQHIKDLGYKVNIKWYYEDDDESILEAGMDLKDIFIMDFDLIKKTA